MTNWFESITGPLDTLSKSAEKLMEIRDLSKLGDLRIELQTQVLAAHQNALAAQADQSAMLERIRSLETEVTRLQAWEREKQRYELKEFGRGTFAYALKEGAQDGQPSHWICPTCYEDGKISPIQQTPRLEMRRRVYRCPRCEMKIHS